jgi:hypothetical protein
MNRPMPRCNPSVARNHALRVRRGQMRNGYPISIASVAQPASIGTHGYVASQSESNVLNAG